MPSRRRASGHQTRQVLRSPSSQRHVSHRSKDFVTGTVTNNVRQQVCHCLRCPPRHRPYRPDSTGDRRKQVPLNNVPTVSITNAMRNEAAEKSSLVTIIRTPEQLLATTCCVSHANHHFLPKLCTSIVASNITQATSYNLQRTIIAFKV